jgi:uncharacterized protein (TIGR03067 family)
MNSLVYRVLLVAVTLSALSSQAIADDAKDEAIKKDRQQIAGTWRIVSLEINGNKVADDDAKKLMVVNDAEGNWSLRSEGKEISKGTNSFDPTQKPKTIDFKITEGGGVGNTHQGVYELGEKSRKLCFAPAGKDRPKEFTKEFPKEAIKERPKDLIKDRPKEAVFDPQKPPFQATPSFLGCGTSD